MSKRLPGRPVLLEGIGRKRIIEGFRHLARRGCCGQISRKDLATFLGITPALITYYFPETNMLLTEAMEDIFASWRDKLAILLEAPCENEYARLAEAIDLIFDFFLAEGLAEQLYGDLVRQKILNGVSNREMEAILIRILDGVDRDGDHSPELLARLIWGACRHSARFDYDAAVVRSALIAVCSGGKAVHMRPLHAQFDCAM